MSGIAKVEETGRFMLVLKDISLEPPHLSIEVRHLDREGAVGGALTQPTQGLGVQQLTRHSPCPGHQTDD